ncbi:hypothetical protein ['Catharanthus roseus' aster yellows phytoplasma]|uniref:Peptidase M41 domain-containing protein n=1 Tax='Catharanthus roseus' aster yellows phytoplasma TaxID=1193712 RepID=A0A4P6M8R7_9MOLU|nr:hypothetical protein ['Catharanthus roseus' aster yellows phytoplasma]QBF23779.1 hypothetical protein EXT02_00910 ['Catharanthus roseus' aster yellows phytoplasma]
MYIVIYIIKINNLKKNILLLNEKLVKAIHDGLIKPANNASLNKEQILEITQNVKIIKDTTQEIKTEDHTKKELSQKETNLLAWHTVGQAVMKHYCNIQLHEMSVKPNNNIGKCNIIIPHEDNEQIKTKENYEKDLLIYLSGRAEEIAFCATEANLSQNDLEKANKVVEEIVKNKIFHIDTDFSPNTKGNLEVQHQHIFDKYLDKAKNIFRKDKKLFF